jgi:hypothetical protein
MMDNPLPTRRQWLQLAGLFSTGRIPLAAADSGPIDIGRRRELFVDDFLVDRLRGARRTLHRPVAREISLERTKPWEGNASGYTTVFQDGDLYRMYYRGTHIVYTMGKGTSVHPEVVCYAESADGIRWTRPDLGIVEFEGSKKNNIIWDGVGSHNFTPFLDTNPARTANAKYKAMGRGKSLNPSDKSRFGHGLYIFESADGIHWKLTRDDTVITEGAFDSQNLAFWDSLRGEYRAYVRDFREGRDIRTCTSKDFIHWTNPVFLTYEPGRMGQLYTNGVIPYYRAPHIFVGFPTRYADYGWAESTKQLPQREYRELVASASQRSGTAFTDSMFMSSRDALHFDVWPESFVRPGPQRPGSWFYGDKYQNWGIVETKSNLPGAANELSFYLSEAGRQKDGNRLRRYTLRVDGFVSVNAPLSGGELLTKSLRFEGNRLGINFSTSAAGTIRVELQEDFGRPIPGFTLDDCDLQYGDELDRAISWKGNRDLSKLAGKPVRLRFELKDAELYALQFTR